MFYNHVGDLHPVAACCVSRKAILEDFVETLALWQGVI